MSNIRLNNQDLLDDLENDMNNNRHDDVNRAFHKYKDDDSFSDYEKDLLFFYNGVSAFYLDKKDEGYSCCKKIILNKNLENNILLSAISNLSFYKSQITKDNDFLELFNEIDFLIQSNYKKHTIYKTHIDVWNSLYEKVEPIFTKYKKFEHNNKSKPLIFLSITSCKRFELFEKTVNSIINMWEDVDKVDYWFCIDDNSSVEDRERLVSLYPWFDFYMKSVDEKGHLESMNIIWDKLNELKPEYWIHLEDDFVFHRKMSYVSKGIEGLDLLKGYNVFQVLFNRSYAETIKDLNIESNNRLFIEGINDFVINKCVNGIGWPHFSFRPSLILTDKILGLGNFYSEKTFFEIAYAYKWLKAGFQSAFFNYITSRHIGRLVGERHTTNLLNAYDLNNVPQGLPFCGCDKCLEKDSKKDS